MCLGPVRYTLRVHAQLASYAPQIHPIHIELYGLLAKFRTVPTGFLDGCVFAATQIASISLTTGCGFAYLVLLASALASGTFHKPILPTNLGTPQSTLIIDTGDFVYNPSTITNSGNEF